MKADEEGSSLSKKIKKKGGGALSHLLLPVMGKVLLVQIVSWGKHNWNRGLIFLAHHINVL